MRSGVKLKTMVPLPTVLDAKSPAYPASVTPDACTIGPELLLVKQDRSLVLDHLAGCDGAVLWVRDPNHP